MWGSRGRSDYSQPESEYPTGGDSPLVRRVCEFHHLSHTLCPLEVKAIDEEQWLLDTALQEIPVDGYHPGVQCQATAGGEGRGEEGRTERKYNS